MQRCALVAAEGGQSEQSRMHPIWWEGRRREIVCTPAHSAIGKVRK